MGWGTDDDEFEIDLTVDAPAGLLPIRWVGPPRHGNGHTNGTGTGTVPVRTRPLPVPRVVTLASFMGQTPAPRETPTRELTPVLDLREPDEWLDTLQPITLRDVATSRAARFLTVVVVTVLAVLIAAIVLLWQRVEAQPTVTATIESPGTALTPAELRDFKTRLDSLETRLAALLDPTGSVVTTSPSATQHELGELRSCIVAFQQAIDAGVKHGGQFKYC